MKRALFVVLVLAGIIYGTGYLSLSDSSVMRYLDHLEELSMNGESTAVCDLFDDKVTVSMMDHTAGRDGKVEGGKDEVCEQVKTTSAAYTLLRPSTTIQRTDFVAERSWLHPWTVNVSYTEHRVITIQQANITRKTESDDKLTLVKTFGGVKITRLQSEAWLED